MMDMYWWIFIPPAFLIAWGFIGLVPVSDQQLQINRIQQMFGFEQAKQDAQSIGITLKWSHYIALSLLSVAAGLGLAYLMKNPFFISVALLMGYVVPRSILMDLRYRKRRETLFNVVPNLRQLVAQFRDSRSLQQALRRSLPIMTGQTKEVFTELYRNLTVGKTVERALEPIRAQIRFSKFNSFCDKVISSEVDGYHEENITTLQDIITEMTEDIQYLKELEIENRNKILMIFVIFALAWGIVYLCAYMEMQLAQQIGTSLSIHSTFGECVMSFMGIVTVLGIFVYKNKWMRMNFDKI